MKRSDYLMRRAVLGIRVCLFPCGVPSIDGKSRTILQD